MEKGRENKGANQYTPERVLSNVDKMQHNTQKELATELNKKGTPKRTSVPFSVPNLCNLLVINSKSGPDGTRTRDPVRDRHVF
jgi:hypothetical protein